LNSNETYQAENPNTLDFSTKNHHHLHFIMSCATVIGCWDGWKWEIDQKSRLFKTKQRTQENLKSLIWMFYNMRTMKNQKKRL